MMGGYTVGWYDKDINDWYFNGEYDLYEDAAKCAQKTATNTGCRARITNLVTGQQEFFESQTN